MQGLFKQDKMFHKGTTNYDFGGVSHDFIFPNGYGAKVARTPRTGGYERGLWEIVVTYEGKPTYDNIPFEWKGLTWLTSSQVEVILQKISDIPFKVKKVLE